MHCSRCVSERLSPKRWKTDALTQALILVEHRCSLEQSWQAPADTISSHDKRRASLRRDTEVKSHRLAI